MRWIVGWARAAAIALIMLEFQVCRALSWVTSRWMISCLKRLAAIATER